MGADLRGYAAPLSASMFGMPHDLQQNGKPPGGVVHMDAPVTEEQADKMHRLDPASMLHPRTSPTFWVAAMVGVLVVLNYRARK